MAVSIKFCVSEAMTVASQNINSRHYRPISSEEQKLYDHLLYWIEREQPREMLQRFRTLFIDGVGYSDAEVIQALRRVINSKLATEDFRYVLNRCCHILINRWQARSQTQIAIPALVKLFETPPNTTTVAATHLPVVRRHHQLIRQFTETEQYHTLYRLAQVLTEAEAANYGNRPLGTLIRRYPYLYGHCLLSEDSTHEQQCTVRQIQSSMQRQFEIHLAHYVTYQARRSQVEAAAQPTAQRLIRPINNPTLLDDQELNQALKYYTGKVDGYRTHRDLALNLLNQGGQPQSFAAFKDDLYEYITASIDPTYGRRKFNNQLHLHLKNTLPENNEQILNDFLLVRTCNQLLGFLIVDSPQHNNHYVFVDLVTNLGAIVTTGLLLKVVLLCRKVIPGLERRLSILFNHYELHHRDAVQWLIQALENTNLALTTNFGAIHLTSLI
jgi:hypothetical protein